MNHVAPLDDGLIDLIYAALLGEATWTDFLAELSRSLPDGRSSLFYHDASRGQGSWDLNFGLDTKTMDASRHYANLNPWMPKASVREVGVGVVSDQMLPSSDLKVSEFYNDFFAPMVRCKAAVGVTIVREEGRSFLLSVMTSRDDPDSNGPAAHRLTVLAPHLRRAFHHFRVGPSQRQIAEIGTSLFDAIDVGLVIIGEGGTVKSLSECAKQIIDAGDCFRITPLGKIKICSPEADTMLRHMLERTLESPKIASTIVGPVKITLIRVKKDRFSAYFEGPTVVVLLEPLRSKRLGDIDFFAHYHKLTAAEIRALSGIVSGRSASEIAEAAALSRETIRSQVKSLYAKTEVGSEADLLRLVARFARLAANGKA